MPVPVAGNAPGEWRDDVPENERSRAVGGSLLSSTDTCWTSQALLRARVSTATRRDVWGVHFLPDRPRTADFPFRAGLHWSVPINGTLTELAGVRISGLTAPSGEDRPQQFQVVTSPGLARGFPSTEPVSLTCSERCRSVRSHARMDDIRQFDLLPGSRSRFHRDDLVRRIVLTGFGEIR
jgi:hypothetical protein